MSVILPMDVLKEATHSRTCAHDALDEVEHPRGNQMGQVEPLERSTWSSRTSMGTSTKWKNVLEVPFDAAGVSSMKNPLDPGDTQWWIHSMACSMTNPLDRLGLIDKNISMTMDMGIHSIEGISPKMIHSMSCTRLHDSFALEAPLGWVDPLGENPLGIDDYILVSSRRGSTWWWGFWEHRVPFSLRIHFMERIHLVARNHLTEWILTRRIGLLARIHSIEWIPSERIPLV